MQAILITFDQAYYERIIDMLQRNNCRGFTSWQEVQGRGTNDGEPHFGSHAWPSLASAIITIVEDSRVDTVLNKLHEWDMETPKLGLRAFTWRVDKTIRQYLISVFYYYGLKEIYLTGEGYSRGMV